MSATEVKTTTCYMWACRCGMRVHQKDGKLPEPALDAPALDHATSW